MKSLFRRWLGGSDPEPAGPLSPDGQLASDLWVDRPDALTRLEGMHASGTVADDEAAQLEQFIRRGYLTFSLGDLTAPAAAIGQDVDRAWRERPADLAYAWSGPLRSFAEADLGRDRRPSYRIADLHSHSAAALDLYLHPAIFRRVELALGRPAVATQSLYFEWGSQQALHRDPVFVQTQPPSHLIAAWIALEDIHPDSGPLVYMPGSHRLPYYQFAPGEFLFDQSRYGPAETQAMAEHDRRQCAAAGLEPETLVCPKGEVLLWHSSLLHGGSAVADPDRTRKSFVVHFSSADRYKLRRQGIVEFLNDGDQRVERHRILETEEILERPGARGFASPMVGYEPPR
ncbi:MAG: phytanoyl-CoA dioxygenase family protein [Acidobacteriota bacterium]